MCCTHCILHIGSVVVESTRKNAVCGVTEGHTERANVIQSYLIEIVNVNTQLQVTDYCTVKAAIKEGRGVHNTKDRF